MVCHLLLQVGFTQSAGGRKVEQPLFKYVLPEFRAEVEFRGVVAVRVGGLVEPHVVFGGGGELALNAYLVFVAGLGEQGARPVAAFLVHAPDKVRLEVAVVAARRFGLGNPVVLGFLHVGVVLDDRLEGGVEV